MTTTTITETNTSTIEQLHEQLMIELYTNISLIDDIKNIYAISIDIVNDTISVDMYYNINKTFALKNENIEDESIIYKLLDLDEKTIKNIINEILTTRSFLNKTKNWELKKEIEFKDFSNNNLLELEAI